MEEEHEELDSMQLYLRALRKKVDHQIKNPFQVDFANYSFEELTNWKNNVLQLDATSKLYGQRVDFLHSGAMQILDLVINLEQDAQSNPKRQDPSKYIPEALELQDSNQILKHLQSPSRLNGGLLTKEPNPLLWRQVMKKRDTLPRLMLNQMEISKQFMVVVMRFEVEVAIETQLLVGEDSIPRVINFADLNALQMSIFEEIGQLMKDNEMFLISLSCKGENERPRAVVDVDSLQEWQQPFNNTFGDWKMYQEDGNVDQPYIDFEQGDNNNIINFTDPVLQVVQFQQESDEDDITSVDSLMSWNSKTTLTLNKKKRRVVGEKNKNKPKERKKNNQIDFSCLNPTRKDVFQIDQESSTVGIKGDTFLNPKDYFLTRFIKYIYPFGPRVRNRDRRSKVRRHNDSKIGVYLTNESSFLLETNPPETFDLNSANLVSNLSKRRQAIVKAPGLPIKELKRRIRAKTQFSRGIQFRHVKQTLHEQQPLDLFISVLHIAAEEGVMIIK